MQCPFLFKTRHSYCKTGAIGLMVPYRADYKKFCCNSSYYRCQVYQASTGVGDLESAKSWRNGSCVPRKQRRRSESSWSGISRPETGSSPELCCGVSGF